MPATTTKRSVTSSILVPVVLFVGLVGLSIAPLSCGTESDDASSEKTSQATGAESSRAILLNIGIEDATKDRPLADAFLIVTPSGARWNPDVLDGSLVTKAFEKYPTGETRTLRLYPEGKAGRALEVPITMTSDMSSVLASSRTDIVVHDDSIVVSGPAVPDERLVFDRPASGSDP